MLDIAGMAADAQAEALAGMQAAGFGHCRWPWLEHDVEELRADLTLHVTRDLKLSQLTDRWRSGSPDPDTLVPGDIAAIRGIAGGNLLEGGQQLETRYGRDTCKSGNRPGVSRVSGRREGARGP